MSDGFTGLGWRVCKLFFFPWDVKWQSGHQQVMDLTINDLISGYMISASSLYTFFKFITQLSLFYWCFTAFL